MCDGPVSALGVSIQMQIVNLLDRLQSELGLAYLFIAHDLSVVRHISNRVAVMYLGKLVEVGETSLLLAHPKHPYTEALLSAVALPDPELRGKRQRIVLEGEIPSPRNPPPGCPFHPRCRYRQARCSTEAPVLRQLPGDAAHMVACHYPEQVGSAAYPGTTRHDAGL